MNDGTGPVEERFYPRIWRRAIATGVVTEIDGAEALKRLPAGQDLWMRVDYTDGRSARSFSTMARHRPGLSSDARCNTPPIWYRQDRDLRECCHARLFTFVR